MTTHELLNPNQRRHFEVLFSMLEDERLRIERLALASLLEPAPPRVVSRKEKPWT